MDRCTPYEPLVNRRLKPPLAGCAWTQGGDGAAARRAPDASVRGVPLDPRAPQGGRCRASGGPEPGCRSCSPGSIGCPSPADAPMRHAALKCATHGAKMRHGWRMDFCVGSGLQACEVNFR